MVENGAEMGCQIEVARGVHQGASTPTPRHGSVPAEWACLCVRRVPPRQVPTLALDDRLDGAGNRRPNDAGTGSWGLLRMTTRSSVWMVPELVLLCPIRCMPTGMRTKPTKHLYNTMDPAY